VQQHICNPKSIISHDESVLDEDRVWVGFLMATKAPDSEEIKELVSQDYHQFLDLFGEPLAQQLHPHRSFNHQMQIQEGKEVPFGPIYHLSEKELGALREYPNKMLAQGKIAK
jgi:hypothetical protein